MNYLYLLLAVEIIFMVYSFRLSGGDVADPAFVMNAVFALSTVTAALNQANWDFVYDGQAFLILSFGLALFTAAVNFGRLLARRPAASVTASSMTAASAPASPTTASSSVPDMKIALWKCILVILFDFYTTFRLYREEKRIIGLFGYTDTGSALIADYKDLQTSNVMSGIYAVNTYVSQMVKIMEAAGYICLFIFLYRTILLKKKATRELLLLIPGFFQMFGYYLQSNRGRILCLISYIIICAYLLWRQKNKFSKMLPLKYIGGGLAGFAAILAAFYASISLIGRQTNKSFFQYISFYMGGSIVHFNQYILSPPSKNLVFAQESFSNVRLILYKLGIVEAAYSSNLEFRRLNTITRGNVYTFFRRPLQDFGLAGMCIFTVAVGLLFAVWYEKLINGRAPSHRQNLRIILYSYFFVWVSMSSIDQYSFSLISAYTAVLLVIVALLYAVLVR